MNLFVATTNPGKLRDFAATASPQITLTPLPDLKQIPAPAEDEPNGFRIEFYCTPAAE